MFTNIFKTLICAIAISTAFTLPTEASWLEYLPSWLTPNPTETEAAPELVATPEEVATPEAWEIYSIVIDSATKDINRLRDVLESLKAEDQFERFVDSYCELLIIELLMNHFDDPYFVYNILNDYGFVERIDSCVFAQHVYSLVSRKQANINIMQLNMILTEFKLDQFIDMNCLHDYYANDITGKSSDLITVTDLQFEGFLNNLLGRKFRPLLSLHLRQTLKNFSDDQSIDSLKKFLNRYHFLHLLDNDDISEIISFFDDATVANRIQALINEGLSQKIDSQWITLWIEEYTRSNGAALEDVLILVENSINGVLKRLDSDSIKKLIEFGITYHRTPLVDILSTLQKFDLLKVLNEPSIVNLIRFYTGNDLNRLREALDIFNTYHLLQPLYGDWGDWLPGLIADHTKGDPVALESVLAIFDKFSLLPKISSYTVYALIKFHAEEDLKTIPVVLNFLYELGLLERLDSHFEACLVDHFIGKHPGLLCDIVSAFKDFDFSMDQRYHDACNPLKTAGSSEAEGSNSVIEVADII